MASANVIAIQISSKMSEPEDKFAEQSMPILKPARNSAQSGLNLFAHCWLSCPTRHVCLQKHAIAHFYLLTL